MVATTSAGVAATLGYEDQEGAPADEMLAAAARIARGVEVPVTVDAEAGYGMQPAELVAALRSAGAAGCNLEDTDHTVGGLRDPDHHAEWLRAVRQAASADGYRLVINARVDVFLGPFLAGAGPETQEGLVPEAVRRANAYLEAGADLAFVEGPTSVEEVRRVCREVKGRVFYNQTGVSPRFSLAQMQELGIAVTIVPGATFRATIEAVYDLAVALRDEGPLAEERFAERFKRHPLGDVHTFAGFDRIREWEAQYLPPEEAEKYADSVGHQPTRT